MTGKAKSQSRAHSASVGPSAKGTRPRKWSQKVVKKSDAMDLQTGVFKLKSARAIANSLKRSSEASRRRKSSPFRSAMSMLNKLQTYARRGRHGGERHHAIYQFQQPCSQPSKTRSNISGRVPPWRLREYEVGSVPDSSPLDSFLRWDFSCWSHSRSRSVCRPCVPE
jgi:hypothetical protein